MGTAADVLGIIREVAIIAAAIVGAVVAILGLGAWRRQLAGKNEYEVALRLLRSAYEVRDAISMVRSPWMSSGEMAAALAEVGSKTDEAGTMERDKKNRAAAAAYEIRWRSLMTARQNLDVAATEAEVHWGEGVVSLVRSLRKCIGKLRGALEMYLREQERTGPLRLSDDAYKDMEETVFQISEDPEKDRFLAEVLGAVKSLENFVRPRLNSSRSGNQR